MAALRWLLISCVVLALASVVASDLSSTCQTSISSVSSDCITYASGGESSPSAACCSGVKGLYKTQPQCLCYLLEQADHPSSQVKVDLLLNLPTACSFANANISQCIKLLHLTPSSPGASIFTNPSSSSTPKSPTTNAAAPASSAAPPMKTSFVGFLLVVASTAFFYALSVGI